MNKKTDSIPLRDPYFQLIRYFSGFSVGNRAGFLKNKDFKIGKDKVQLYQRRHCQFYKCSGEAASGN